MVLGTICEVMRSDKQDGGVYQYRAVFVLGGGWRLRGWTTRPEAIEDIGIAKEKGAVATAIERKHEDTEEIERAQTPGSEWTPEDELDIQIREAKQ